MALNDYWRRLTRLDRSIVMILLALCIVLFVVIGKRSPGQSIRVMQDSSTIYTAALNGEQKVDLQGPLGVTRLIIRSGHAYIASSPCPYKICVGMGEISREGEIIACVPNRLLVQVVGKSDNDKEAGYDLLSR